MIAHERHVRAADRLAIGWSSLGMTNSLAQLLRQPRRIVSVALFERFEFILLLHQPSEQNAQPGLRGAEVSVSV